MDNKKRITTNILDSLGPDPFSASLKSDPTSRKRGDAPANRVAIPSDTPPATTTSTQNKSTPGRDVVKFSCQLPRQTRDLMYSAVDALAGPPLYLGVMTFLEEAIKRHARALQNEYNNGAPFPFTGKNARNRRGRRRP